MGGLAGRQASAAVRVATHTRPARNGGSAGAVEGGQECALAHHSQPGLFVVQGSKGGSCRRAGRQEEEGTAGAVAG